MWQKNNHKTGSSIPIQEFKKNKDKRAVFFREDILCKFIFKNQGSHVVYTQGDTAQKGQTAHHDHVNSTLLPRKPQ